MQFRKSGGIMLIKEYEKIQKIEASLNKKLLNYINEEYEYKEILSDISNIYPSFGEYKDNLTFNLWFSMDFVNESGLNYIDKFLEINSSKMTDLEKDLLVEKKKSNVSLFEIVSIEDMTIKVYNLLENQIIEIYEPELSNILKVSDLIFGRIGSFLKYNSFIGEINYLPTNAKEIFLQEVLLDFNSIRKYKKDLIMKDYLKQHSINLYSIYTDCMFESIEIDEDITYDLYDELEEFESYLHYKKDNIQIKTMVNNLIDFFEYYLLEEGLSLYHIDKIQFYPFFLGAIEDGFITSFEDLNSYIFTFKKYLMFLAKKDSRYQEKYKEILDISSNRFKLFAEFQNSDKLFNIDGRLSGLILENLTDQGLSSIMDFDKFLLFIYDNPLKLSPRLHHIRKEDLLQLTNILENTQDEMFSSLKQSHIPIVNLFYNFSLDLGLTFIEEDTMYIEELGSKFIKLKDSEKYSLFLDYLFKQIDLENLLVTGKLDYDVYEVLEVFDIFRKDLKNKSVKITNLGNILYRFLNNNPNVGSGLIYLNDYKKKD